LSAVRYMTGKAETHADATVQLALLGFLAVDFCFDVPMKPTGAEFVHSTSNDLKSGVKCSLPFASAKK
jgi:hypothetical protein